MFNYLFFRFLGLKVYDPVYFAKIFVTCIEAVVFFPGVFAVLRGYLGCELYNKVMNSWEFDLSWSIVAVILVFINFRYYSLHKILKLKKKYADESIPKRRIKLIFICAVLLGIFLFADDLIKVVLHVPKC